MYVLNLAVLSLYYYVPLQNIKTQRYNVRMPFESETTLDRCQTPWC